MPTLLSLLSVAFSPEAAKHQSTASPATDTLSEMDFSAEFDALTQVVLPRPVPPVSTETEPQPGTSPIGPVEKSADHVETQETPEDEMALALASAKEESAQILMKAAPRQGAPEKPAFVKPDQPNAPIPGERPLIAIPARSNEATMATPSFPVTEPIQPDFPSAPAIKIPQAGPVLRSSTMKVTPAEQDIVGRIHRSIQSAPRESRDQSGLLSPPQKSGTIRQSTPARLAMGATDPGQLQTTNAKPPAEKQHGPQPIFGKATPAKTEDAAAVANPLNRNAPAASEAGLKGPVEQGTVAPLPVETATQKPEMAHPRTFIQPRPAQRLEEVTPVRIKSTDQLAENPPPEAASPDQKSTGPKAKPAISTLSNGYVPQTRMPISGSAKARIIPINADKYSTAPAAISSAAALIPQTPVFAGTQVLIPAADIAAQVIFNRQLVAPDGSDKTRRADNKTACPFAQSTILLRPASTGVPVVALLTAVPNVSGPQQNLAQRSDRNHPRFAAELQSGLRADGIGLPPVATAVARPELPMHVAQQIIDVVQTLPSRPVEISLNPEELGRLRLSLSSSEHGLVVHILAERPETTDLLRRHIGQLDQDLLDLGFDSVAFSFAEQNHPDSGENQQGDRALAPHSDQSVNPAGTPSIPTRASPSSPTGGLDLRL